MTILQRLGLEKTAPTQLELYTSRLNAVRSLRDFAIGTGYMVTDEVIVGIDALDPNDFKTGFPLLLKFERDLTQITKPLSILNMPEVSARGVLDFKWNLIVIAVVALVVCVAASIGANLIFRGGTASSAQFVLAIMLYGAALGLLGAVIYELFHVVGVLGEAQYKFYDSIANYTRLIAGALLGWLFTTVFSWQQLAKALQFGDGSGGATSAEYAYLLLPFLAGYSSALVVGVLTNLIDGASVALGLKKS